MAKLIKEISFQIRQDKVYNVTVSYSNEVFIEKQYLHLIITFLDEYNNEITVFNKHIEDGVLPPLTSSLEHNKNLAERLEGVILEKIEKYNNKEHNINLIKEQMDLLKETWS